MALTIVRLQQLLPAPSNPVNTGNEALWAQLENRLTIVFPTDYKDFINLYGTGEISGLLYVINPFETSESYLKVVERAIYAYNSGKENFPALYPFEVSPHPNGLYPWAKSSNGHVLYWQIGENPDEWPIIIYGEEPEYEKIQNTVTDFLYLWLSGSLASVLFPTEEIETTFRV